MPLHAPYYGHLHYCTAVYDLIGGQGLLGRGDVRPDYIYDSDGRLDLPVPVLHAAHTDMPPLKTHARI